MEIANYLLFMSASGERKGAKSSVLLGPLFPCASAAFRWQASTTDNFVVWLILCLSMVFSSLVSLCNTAMTVSVERDW